MKIAVLSAIALALVGCATTQTRTTAQFYEREAETVKMCMASADKLPVELRLKVDPAKGYSPYTAAAWCYASQIRSVASVTQYPNAPLVHDYADYLVRLMEARDMAIIDNNTAMASYRQITALFKQAITTADQQHELATRRELVDRLAVFAIAMANVSAEQERQRQANRPVTCVLTGIYRTSGVTCI